MQNSKQKSKPTNPSKENNYDRVQMAVPRQLHRHLKKLAFSNEYDSLASFHTIVINAGLKAMNLPVFNSQA